MIYPAKKKWWVSQIRGSREPALGWKKPLVTPLGPQSAGSRSTPEADHGVLDHHEEQDLVEVVPSLFRRIASLEGPKLVEIPS